MNYKRVIGLLIVAIGIILLFVSFYIRNRVSDELGSVKRKTEMVQNNPFTKAGGNKAKQVTGKGGAMVNEMAKDRAAGYVTASRWIFFSGIVLIIIGAIIFFFGRSTPKGGD